MAGRYRRFTRAQIEEMEARDNEKNGRLSSRGSRFFKDLAELQNKKQLID
jgi:hypothetical protein